MLPGATVGNRTRDLFLTKKVLYQLSYCSIKPIYRSRNAFIYFQ